MRIVVVLVLFLVSSLAIAGGDFALGKIKSISGANGNYSFHFIQTGNETDLIKGCKELDVTVNYERVPWFSWLPLIHSSHPSKENTIEAATFLINASRENREVNFGYMGYGLVPSNTQCSFSSRGLSLQMEKEKIIVLSYHDPV